MTLSTCCVTPKCLYIPKEESFSDLRYVSFNQCANSLKETMYRNPRGKNGDTYCTQLQEEVKRCPQEVKVVRNSSHFECLNSSLTEAIMRSYSDNNSVYR